MKNTIGGVAVMTLMAGMAFAGPSKTRPPHPRAVQTNHAQKKAAEKTEKNAIKQDIKNDKRDVKADRAELRRLRADLKAAERAGDTGRAARDRAAIADLERDMKADRADIKADKREKKTVKK